MTGLDYEVWDGPVQKYVLFTKFAPVGVVEKYVRILVSHRRTGSPEDALTRAVRAPAAMWNLRLAKSVGDGATDAVVVALDMSTPQARRRKEFESVVINDVGTTLREPD
jgi:hypothetical protein